MADDLAIKMWHAVTDVDPTSSNQVALRFTTEWTGFDASEVTFSCPAGKLMIFISFQFHSNAFLLGADRTPGAVFAIELDDAPQMNSIIGAADVSNEYIDNTNGANPLISYDSSPSFRGLYSPHQVTGTYTVSAGQHRVRLVHRNLSSFDAGSTEYQWIGTLETIVLWMWA